MAKNTNRLAGLSELLRERTEQASEWAEAAHQSGWLSLEQAQGLKNLSGTTSRDLFAEDAGEPLVVALFGGTGVGKSSLLNRLVGEPIAKVGVIRPTSLEATVYVHEALDFAGPPRSGFERASHTNDERRNVVWVDMPDVDSTAAHNRELVLDFLPFVDVLIYVVSPERYRDEAPWALLSAHAERSAWVFVMNQIDRGQTAQLDDLSKAVAAAGFKDPMLFATSCGQPVALDQFDALAAFIDSLAQERLREALQEEGRAARLRLLSEQVASVSAHWPEDPASFANAWNQRKKALTQGLQKDLVDRLAPVAARMSQGEAAAPGELWDEWANERVADALAEVRISAASLGWSQPALARLDAVVDPTLTAKGEAALRESVRMSLARPGTTLQRGLFTACRWLQYALPLLALLWIGWFVVSGFYNGATGEGAFVADGFALNAVLLVGLCAGLPWLLGRLSKPSPRKAAMLGVRRGLDTVVEYIDDSTSAQIAAATEQLDGLRAQRDALAAPIDTVVRDHNATDGHTAEAKTLNARLRRSS